MLELARQEDREAVNALAMQVHALHVAWRPDIYETVPELYSQSRFDSAIKARELYIARIEGIIVGYAAVKFREYNWQGVVRRKVMLIDEICVDALCRGHGIGTEIMAHIRVLAKAFGCKDLQLSVNAHNDEAIGFYQKCGFMIQNITMQTKV